MDDIMARVRYVVLEKEDYSSTMCEQCGSGDNPEELLLCDVRISTVSIMKFYLNSGNKIEFK
jgi:hypothetical protein